LFLPSFINFSKVSSPFFQRFMCSSAKSFEESEGQEGEAPTMAEAATQIQDGVSLRETGICPLPFPFSSFPIFLCLVLLHDPINFVDVDMGTKGSKLLTTEEAKGPLPAIQAIEAWLGISQTTPRPEGLSLLEEKDTTIKEAPKMTVSDPNSGLPAFLTSFDSLEFNSLLASHFHRFGPPFVNFLQFFVPVEVLSLL